MIKVTIIDCEMAGSAGVQWINPYAIVVVRAYEYIDYRTKEWYDAATASAKEHYDKEVARLRQIHAAIKYAPSGQSWGTIRVAETPEQIAAMMEVACRPVQLSPDRDKFRDEILAEVRGIIGEAMDRHLVDIPHDGAEP